MGLFNLFGSKKAEPEKRTTPAPAAKDIEKILRDSDKAISEMYKADAAYEKNGDIDKRIRVYEKYMLKKPEWNSFNFNMALAKMYVKAGRNDTAWGYLNQMYLWAIDPTAIGGDVSKIRFEQFKILKAEKKYKDAMVMLVSSYVVNAYGIQGTYFNKEKFKKDAKTTVKGIGISEADLVVFADRLEKDIKTRKIKEATVQKYCAEWYSKHGV